MLHSRRVRHTEVVKSRGQDSLGCLHTFKIGEGGITVFPRQKAPLLQPRPVAYEEEKLAFGVQGLDEMLEGGVFRRSSTLIASSSGTGKSLLSLQFLIDGARRGKPGLFVSLEEPSEQVINNARVLAPEADELVQQGKLTVIHLSPLETDKRTQRAGSGRGVGTPLLPGRVTVCYHSHSPCGWRKVCEARTRRR